ncbi:MAG: arsenate reductase ArsC [Candidatus Latescibacterota bacterium]|jgi:arsenate reductase
MASNGSSKTKVLFVCIGNMCRSPMAEGFARALGGDVVEPFSAGLHPTGVVSEDAILMMEEHGIDIARQRSNGLDEVPLNDIDIVVSMTGIPAEQVFPSSFKGKLIDWDVDDPIGRPLSFFRRVRGEIEEKVTNLLEEIRKANFSSKT